MRFMARQVCLFLMCLMFAVAGGAVAEERVYEIDALNIGLGAPPDKLDRSSPRSTMEALLDLAEAGAYPAAAHLLNLEAVPAAQQATRGPELARQLFSVIDRKVVISWGKILDRPDGMDAQATSDSAVAGQARRSILVTIFTLDDRPYPVYLDRVKAGDADPVWVFSERTVVNIPKLYDKFGPSDIEKMLPDWARQDAFWHLMWWEVLCLPVLILLALLGGVLTHRLMTRIAQAADRDFVTKVIEASRMPAVLFVVTFIAAQVSGIFVFSGPVDTLVAPAVALGYVLTALLLALNVIDRIIDQLVVFDNADLKQVDQGNMRERTTKVALVRRMLTVIIVLVGFGVVLAEAGFFRTFGFSLLASAGAITLVLGFAAREVLSNIMSSMQIAMNQSARIGDKVLYKGHLCNVERINFTYVLLRVWTGVRLVVPVTELVSETFEN